MSIVETLHRFIDSTIYNGAPGKGQSLYNEGGNPWLHDQVLNFLEYDVRDGVCLTCGGAVMPGGEHLDISRHEAALHE